MMRWLRRLLVLALLLVAALAAPVIYVETACRPAGAAEAHSPLLPAAHHRAEARTLLTYPEWHIVHAYDDYARTIAAGDPHDFGYALAVTQYWRTLCALTRASGPMGGVDGETRQLVHVIGVSFTAELALKATYEETLGRLFAALRGDGRAPLDDLSATQAAAYARFLQQVPWYKWDFTADAKALDGAATSALRDRERRLALGLEYRAKAAYAGVIAGAVAAVGPDELTLRMVVSGASTGALAALDGVTVIGSRGAGTEIETPRYRALTSLLAEMADNGADFIEIAGNDDILLTALASQATAQSALMSLPRQGYGDHRHLLLVKVPDLAKVLRGLKARGLKLEHVHDY